MFEYIERFYPLGMSVYDQQFNNSPKFKLLLELSRKTSVAQNNLWAKIIRNLKSEQQFLEVQDKFNDLHPCYSASILLFKQKSETLTYERELRIHVCAIAPFYTVLGFDSVTINQVRTALDPLIFVSPISIYEKWFSSIRILVSEHFPKFRLIPFDLLQEQVPGLSLHETNGDCVFQALFTPENVSRCKTIGNPFYE